MSKLQHPLCIPELTHAIISYLKNPDIVSLYYTSKHLHQILASTIWENICFRSLPRYTLPKDPFTKIIKLDRQHDPIVLNILNENQQWIKSLSIIKHNSLVPLQFAESCTNLKSFEIQGIASVNEKNLSEYWETYKKFMEKHQSTLHAITFISWTTRVSGVFLGDDPLWLKLTHSSQISSLRSLTFRYCIIRKKNIPSFWIIFQQLEILKLIHTKIDFKELQATAKSMAKTNSKIEEGNSIFPKLQELVIEKLTPNDGELQFNALVSKCPQLRKLEWDMVHSEAPMTAKFFNYILSGNLPLLDSLSVRFGSPPDDIIFNQVLRYLRRPFKVLDVQVSRISDDSFDLLRKGHFNTLQTIDLSGSSPMWYYRPNSGIRSDWTIQVLTSCPSLEVIKSKLLTSEDIISSGPWVCRGLKTFSVYIEMIPITNIPKERLVEEELQHCQIIYQRLSELEELQVLEMFDSTTFSGAMRYRPRGIKPYSIPLPLRLNAGLGQLSKLTELTTISFWSGHHAVPKKEYRWMLDHWKKLEKIFGGWRIEEGSASKIQDKYLWAGKLREWLEYQGITVSAYYQEYRVGKGPDKFNFGLCSEGEGKTTTLEWKLAQLST